MKGEGPLPGRRPARRFSRTLSIAASAVLWIAAPAAASGPNLTVTNLGQPTIPVVVGQPPVTVAANGGSCATPFTLTEESACPPGTWPQLGTWWGPEVNVAGGDTLELEFAGPVSNVAAASTSNYEPGLTDPSGNPVPNFDVMGPTAASETSPTEWTVTLPQLDVRGMNGHTFSVVAQDEGGWHDYALVIRSPRYENEELRCGQAYYSTGFSVGYCESGTPPKGSAPDGPEIHLAAARYARGILRLRATGSMTGVLDIRVPVRGGKGHRTLSRKISAGKRRWISAKVPNLRLSRANRFVAQLTLHTAHGDFGGGQHVIAVRRHKGS